MPQMTCQVCGKGLEVAERVRRRDDCPHCGADLHACIQCRFHDPGYHNQCRENQAEYASDKERANFCGFYQPRQDDGPGGGDAKADAEAMWEKMFGQK